MLPLFAIACALPIETTTLSGVVTDARDGGAPVAAAAVTLREQFGTIWEETTTDDSGAFTTSVPSNQLFFLHTEAEGFVTTSYTGWAGDAALEVSEEGLWMQTEADLDALREEFTGCAGEVDPERGVIEGEVRLLVIEQEDLSELPLVTTASLLAYSESGVAYSACYLDDDGVSDPDAVWTGETGRFAFFNVPPGIISLHLSYDYGGPDDQEDWYYAYLTAGGVAPMYPVAAGMPGT